jgi:hypothetical protein
MKFTVDTSGFEELKNSLAGFSDRRFRATIATALTRTAKKGAQIWQGEITQSVDRPTARTQSATSFTGANANNLQATIFVKDKLSGTAPDAYLQPLVKGGSRMIKKFEQALVNSGVMPAGYVTVPGRAAPRDSYGNITRSLIIQVIAQLGSDYSPGYRRVISTSVAKRLARQKKLGKTYIVVQPGEERKYKTDAGIYLKAPDGRRLAMFLFKRSVRYGRTVDLMGRGTEQVQQLFENEMNIAMKESIEALIKKGQR